MDKMVKIKVGDKVKTAIQLPQIRGDIYAVKQYDPMHGHWCYVAMSKDLEKAKQRLRDARYPVLGINYRAKLVHPAQWVVDAFVAAGNRID